jgi:hypothetical protein
MIGHCYRVIIMLDLESLLSAVGRKISREEGYNLLAPSSAECHNMAIFIF